MRYSAFLIFISFTLTVSVALERVPLQTPFTSAESCEYWVAPAPEGDDHQTGAFAEPWATLNHAAAQVPDKNCTVWFKNGVYSGTNELKRRFTSTTTFKAVNPYQAIFEHSGTVLELDGIRNMTFEGFEFRHSGPGANKHVVIVDRRDDIWSENIIFRNNIFHDSYNNDLLKVHNGVRFATIEHNIFYNQGDSEQHIDVNSVTDVIIQDNIFFNDFAGSGRSNPGNTKHFIVVKDSNENSDGLEGSERITIRRNIFLNWEGGVESFVQIGNDGKPYHEAEEVQIENNLMIGNAQNLSLTALGVRGARSITFTNNTVVGDLPAKAYAIRVSITGQNPKNEAIYIYNNVWSDPTGTMGAKLSGSSNEFSDGDPSETNNLILDNNLYWNGGTEIPPGDLVSPLLDDARRLVADPGLNTDHTAIILPRWQGTAFMSGNITIRQEFVRLVEGYGRISSNSPAIGQADLSRAPFNDILGHLRGSTPDLGAYEYDYVIFEEQVFLPMTFKKVAISGDKIISKFNHDRESINHECQIR